MNGCCLYLVVSGGGADFFSFSFLHPLIPLMSEIDHIFASKGKSEVAQPVVLSSTAAEKRRKKDKKQKSDVETKIDNDVTAKKRPAPKIIVDPSVRIPSAKRAKMLVVTTSKHSLKPNKEEGAKEDEDRFKDSRGNGPRKCNP